MPLSLAHPAVVLPLQRAGLPLSALAVGAVAPDLPAFLPVGVGYETTHDFAGLPATTVIGLLLLGLWDLLLRDAVVDLVGVLRARRPAHARLGLRAWLLAPVAVAVGAATHVLWDSATHDWGFVVESVDALRRDLGPLPAYAWAQHLSTVVGSAVVLACALRWLRRRTARSRSAAVPRPALWLVPVPVAAPVGGLVLGSLDAAVGAALLAGLAVAASWRLSRAAPAAPSR